jgi:DNA-binding NarL/FixJ family response regulator
MNDISKNPKFRRKKKKTVKKPVLSPREREVLVWVAKGKSNSVIADILGVSESTVDTFLRRLYNKLNATNRITAVVKAIRLGIIVP